jgi:hypothetical protein
VHPTRVASQDLAAVRSAASATLLELDPRHHSPAAVALRTPAELQEALDRTNAEIALLRERGVEAVGWTATSKRFTDHLTPAYATVDERTGMRRRELSEEAMRLAMLRPTLLRLIQSREETGEAKEWRGGGGWRGRQRCCHVPKWVPMSWVPFPRSVLALDGRRVHHTRCLHA